MGAGRRGALRSGSLARGEGSRRVEAGSQAARPLFVTSTSGGLGGAQVGFLHYSCSGPQVAGPGILCHWYLRWLRWLMRLHNKAPVGAQVPCQSLRSQTRNLPTCRWHLPYSVSFSTRLYTTELGRIAPCRKRSRIEVC